MGKATGVFLILAGVGTAALVLPAVDKDAERQLAEVVRIATGAAPQVTPDVRAAQSGPVAPAPNRIVIAPILSPPSAPPTTKLATANVAAAPALSEQGNAPSLMAPPQIITRNATASPARPADSEARADLARDIQRELKRVGCYDGELTGDWSPVTRRAMKTFIDRVNAALPIDEPDHILRTMVQGHPGAACGKTCPNGQSASSDGRCLPSAILAQKTPGRTDSPSQDVAAVQRAAAPKVAVPKDIAATTATPSAAVTTGSLAAARPAAPKAAWETTVAAAPVAPLPGGETRMAIGGPSAQGSQQGSQTGVANAQRAQPNGSNGVTVTTSAPGSYVETSLVPGAIAALASGAAGAAVASRPETRGPREPAIRLQRAAAIESKETPAVEIAKPAPVITAKPSTPRPQPIRRSPPEVFKFPAPNYLGFSAPKFVSGYQKPERSTYGPRVYENFVRNLR